MNHATCPAPTTLTDRIGRTLALLESTVPFERQMLHAGERLYRTGEALQCVYIVHAGFCKSVSVAADGREQVVALHLKGDWMGLDGIADGRFSSDALAMDTSEIWRIRYDTLLRCCAQTPELMVAFHAAMSRELVRDRDSMLALCTLSADARVADFLRQWADALNERGLRTDQITLRMTRAEIGNYLGMKLETVSRALSRLARDKVIGFAENGRRDLRIPDVAALNAFVERSVALAPMQ